MGLDNIFHPSPVIWYKNFCYGRIKVFYTGNLQIYDRKQPEGPYLITNKPADIIKGHEESIYSSGRKYYSR